MLNWFDATEAEEIGAKLAEFFASRIPPEFESNPKTLAKRADVIQKTIAHGCLLSKSIKLNIYKKAKLCNQFKWALLDMGYDKTFVDDFTREIILTIK